MLLRGGEAEGTYGQQKGPVEEGGKEGRERRPNQSIKRMKMKDKMMSPAVQLLSKPTKAKSTILKRSKITCTYRVLLLLCYLHKTTFSCCYKQS